MGNLLLNPFLLSHFKAIVSVNRYLSRLAFIYYRLSFFFLIFAITAITQNLDGCEISGFSAVFTNQVNDVGDHTAAVFVVQQIKARIANLLLEQLDHLRPQALYHLSSL